MVRKSKCQAGILDIFMVNGKFSTYHSLHRRENVLSYLRRKALFLVCAISGRGWGISMGIPRQTPNFWNQETIFWPNQLRYTKWVVIQIKRYLWPITWGISGCECILNAYMSCAEICNILIFYLILHSGINRNRQRCFSPQSQPIE